MNRRLTFHYNWDTLPTSLTLTALGQTQVLTVTGIYSDGSQQVLTNGLSFISSNPSIARVDLSGNVTAIANGTATITVSLVGVTAVQVPVTVTPPVLLSVNPNSGQQGQQNLSVIITAQFTHFSQGTTMASFGAGVTVASVVVNSATSATAVLNIDPAAILGPRSITLTTGSEVETLANGFTVTAGTPVLLSVNPNSGQPGQQNLSVVLTGQFTNWVQGTTTANFGAGITVASLNVSSSTSATAVLNIDPSAVAGARTVTLTTGSEIDNLANGFNVTASTCVAPPSGLVSWWRAEGNANDSSDGNSGTLNNGVTFAPGKVGQGFSFNNAGFVGVADASNLDLRTVTLEAWINLSTLPSSSADFDIVTKGAGAPEPENYGLYVTTRNGPAELLFEWANGGALQAMSTGSGLSAGAFHHVAVTADGAAVNFYVDGQPTGQVRQAAALLPNNLALQIGSDEPNFDNRFDGIIDELSIYNRALSAFEIQSIFAAGSAGKCEGQPAIQSVTPNSGQQGQQNLSVSISGQFTNWVQGTTTASFGAGITVTSLTVSSSTSATAVLNLDAQAATGTRTVTMTTGSEVATLNNGFTVSGNQILFYSGPDELRYGNFGLPSISDRYAVTDQFSIGSNSIVTAISFSAWIPTGNVPSSVAWAITTAPGLADMISSGTGTLSNSLTATNVQGGNDVYWSTLSVDAPLAAGTYWLWLADGMPSLNGGLGWGYTNDNGVSEDFFSNGTFRMLLGGTQSFELDGCTADGAGKCKAQPAITSLNPNNGQQGQQNLSVALVGQFTNWVQGTTTASFGAGVTVASLTVSSSTSATAVLNIDPAAAGGGRTVTMTTGTEIDTLTNGFAVIANTPVLLSVNPNSGQQGQQNLSVELVGQFTNWVQGTTTASFSTGIAVSSLTVHSPTSATAVLNIDPAAPTGSGDVTLITGTEIDTLASGFTVKGQPVAMEADGVPFSVLNLAGVNGNQPAAFEADTLNFSVLNLAGVSGGNPVQMESDGAIFSVLK